LNCQNNNSVSSSSDALFVGHPSNQASSQYSHSLYNHPSNNHNFNPLHQSQSPFLSDSHSRQLPPLQTLHGHHLHLHDRDDDDSGSGGMIRPNHSRSNTRRSDSTNPLETKRRRFNSDVDVSINFQRSVEDQAEEDIDVGGWLNNPSPEGLDQENQEQMMSTRSSQIKNQNHNHTFIRQENRSEEVDAILDVGLEIDQDQELQNQPPQPQTNPKKKRKRPPKEKAKQDLDGEVEVNHQYPVDLKPTTTIEEDEPLYVNAKQYSRILARRNARHEKEVEKEEIWRSMWQDKIKEICDTTLRHKLQKDGNGGEKSYDKEILSEALKIAIDEGWENWSEYGPKVKKGKGKGEEIVMETRIGEDGKVSFFVFGFLILVVSCYSLRYSDLSCF